MTSNRRLFENIEVVKGINADFWIVDDNVYFYPYPKNGEFIMKITGSDLKTDERIKEIVSEYCFQNRKMLRKFSISRCVSDIKSIEVARKKRDEYKIELMKIKENLLHIKKELKKKNQIIDSFKFVIDSITTNKGA